jgi:hypothetical protein
MKRLAVACAMGLLAFGAASATETRSWNVTEESSEGIKGAQGSWTVTIDSGNKINGAAELLTDNGAPLTYKIDGSVKDDVYIINLIDRSDGKKGCVWTDIRQPAAEHNGLDWSAMRSARVRSWLSARATERPEVLMERSGWEADVRPGRPFAETTRWLEGSALTG